MTQLSINASSTYKLAEVPSEVRYKHLRVFSLDFETFYDEVYNRGGITVAYRYLTSEELIELIGTDIIPAILVGFAGCSIEDNFARHVGRKIAAERLKDSNVIIAGDDYIERLMTASEVREVREVLEAPMAAQGLRFDLCTF